MRTTLQHIQFVHVLYTAQGLLGGWGGGGEWYLEHCLWRFGERDGGSLLFIT